MEVKDKFYVTTNELTTPYLKSDMPTRIMVASDIHYQTRVSRDLFTQIVKYAQETKPDFIVMPGDQIETIDFIDNSENKEFFESIIRGLSEVAPLIIIPGNHEIKEFSKANFSKRLQSGNSDVNVKAMAYFESLNRIKNVFFLNNDKIQINGVTFLGFNPSLSSYLKVDDKKTEDEFIEDYLKSGLKMAEEEYNILLTHSPLQLVSDGVFTSVKDFNSLTDLVISGHLHDGYLPKSMDKKYGKTNAGLFMTPLVAPFPGIVCRGVHDFGRGYLFVSQGYRKWTADIGLFNFFERFTANDIENLMLEKGKEKRIITSEEMPYSTRKMR